MRSGGEVLPLADFSGMHRADDMVFDSVYPQMHPICLIDAHDGGKFCAIRTDLREEVRLHFEEVSLVGKCAAVSKDRTIENVGFYEILEHMAAVAELRHISGAVGGDLADGVNAGDVHEANRDAKLRRAGADAAGNGEQNMMAASFIILIAAPMASAIWGFFTCSNS